jgi:sec-independent protein translocase protein TatA
MILPQAIPGIAQQQGVNIMPIRLGPFELIIVLVIVIIIFGVGRLPEIGGAVGKAISEFRDATETPDKDEPTSEASEEETTSA